MQVLYEQAAKDQLKEKEYKSWIQAWQNFWVLYKERAQMFSRLPQNEVLTPLKKKEQKEKNRRNYERSTYTSASPLFKELI